MPASHSRRPSGQQHHSSLQPGPQTSPAKHNRTRTAPETPTLLHLPSSSSAGASGASGASASPRSRRATNPSTPARTPTQVSASSATSPSYFSPQPAACGKDARSPTARRPPASFSGHGIDTSRGPPITLITRGNSDIARRTSQQPSDFAFAQQQLAQLGLVSPGGTSRSSRPPKPRRDDSEDSGESTHQTQTNTPTLSRQNSTRTSRRQRQMASSIEGSSEYDSGMRSQSEERHAASSHRGITDTSGTDAGQGEDLFLHIADDNAARESFVDTTSRTDRLRVSSVSLFIICEDIVCTSVGCDFLRVIFLNACNSKLTHAVTDSSRRQQTIVSISHQNLFSSAVEFHHAKCEPDSLIN